MARDDDLSRINAEIDLALRENRPDRYNPDDADWQDAIIERIAGEVPDAHVRRLYARELTTKRESIATRRANKILRSMFDEAPQGQLDWWNDLNDPIALHWEIEDDNGGVRKIKERVALRAVHSRDFLRWAQVESARADDDHKARMRTVDNVNLAARKMHESRIERFDDWAREYFGGAQ